MHSRIATAAAALALLSLATPGACQGIWTNATGLPPGTRVKSMHILTLSYDGGAGVLSTEDSQQFMTGDLSGGRSWRAVPSTPNVQQLVEVTNGVFAVTREPSANNTVIMRLIDGSWRRADPGHSSFGGNGYIVNGIHGRTGRVVWTFGWVTFNGSLTDANGIAEQRVWRSRGRNGVWEVEKIIRAPLATAPPSTWIGCMSSVFGNSVGQVYSGSVWIAYRAGGRIDRFEEGSGYRPDAFRQQRWGQKGDRVVSLLALPAHDGSSGLRCMALVETGGPGAEPFKQRLLLWNGAAWVKKHETAAPDQRLFSLTGGTTLKSGIEQGYFLAVLESQPYRASLLELREHAPAFTEAARFECPKGVPCGPLDLRTARVDVLDTGWAVAAALMPAGGGTQRLASYAVVGGVWRPGAPLVVPATELTGVQALPPYYPGAPGPWPSLFTVATRGLGVLYINSTAFPLAR